MPFPKSHELGDDDAAKPLKTYYKLLQGDDWRDILSVTHEAQEAWTTTQDVLPHIRNVLRRCHSDKLASTPSQGLIGSVDTRGRLRENLQGGRVVLELLAYLRADDIGEREEVVTDEGESIADLAAAQLDPEELENLRLAAQHQRLEQTRAWHPGDTWRSTWDAFAEGDAFYQPLQGWKEDECPKAPMLPGMPEYDPGEDSATAKARARRKTDMVVPSGFKGTPPLPTDWPGTNQAKSLQKLAAICRGHLRAPRMVIGQLLHPTIYRGEYGLYPLMVDVSNREKLSWQLLRHDMHGNELPPPMALQIDLRGIVGSGRLDLFSQFSAYGSGSFDAVEWLYCEVRNYFEKFPLPSSNDEAVFDEWFNNWTFRFA